MARKYPTARVGNYAAPVDPTGMDSAMQNTMGFNATKPMDKTEKNYVNSRKGAPSAIEAVRRARKANKQPPIDD